VRRSRLLEVVALWCFAGAQPLLDVFGDSPETFVFRGAGRWTVVAFAVVVVAVPPMAVFVAVEAVGLASTRLRDAAHVLVLAVLAAALGVQVVKELGGAGAVALAGGTAAAVVLTVLHARVAGFRLFLHYASAAPVLFVALFLVASPASSLVSGGELGRAGVGGNDTPVVVLVLDELPLQTLLDADGEIDGDLYPGFARLASLSTWYRDATSVQGNTNLAVPALLTGRYPDGTPPPTWVSHPESLFALLSGRDDLFASESLTDLCPDSLCTGGDATRRSGLRGLLGDARRVLRDRWGLSEARVELEAFAEVGDAPSLSAPSSWADTEQPARVTELLERIESAPGVGAVSFLHLVLPHVPYVHLPSGARYDAPEVSPGISRVAQWEGDPWLSLLARERHVLQTQYTDRLVGRVVDVLAAQEWFDDAVVVVTADHGASFRPGERFRVPSPRNYEEVLWVPLFVKYPGQHGGRVSDDDVELVDVVPTVADVLDVEIPWRVDGVSMLGEGRPDDGEKRYVHVSLGAFAPEPDEVRAYDAVEGRRRLRVGAYPSARVGDVRDWPAQLGPHGALVGRAVEVLGVGPSSAGSIAWRRAPDEVGRGAPLPAWIEADVRGVARGEWVAVAVDGVVAAVAPVTAELDGVDLRAVLPEHVLGGGSHVTAAFVVTGADGPALVPLART
jgi:hypothetical protein